GKKRVIRMLRKKLFPAADNFCRQPAPPRRRQASRLFKAAGEVTLMGEASIGCYLRQLAPSRYQAALGLVNLAPQQKVLGCLANQIGKPAVKMERAEMRLSRDVIQRRILVELLLHVFQRWQQA